MAKSAPLSFECLASFTSDGAIPVMKFKSLKTGMQLVIAQTEGPLVYGFFCLATEAHDDDGCPHTLEHLVFLGSELYPYKGVLDSLANRCLARGTNAWTDTDHTCYTLDTAGGEGFLNLLPVYLDHILYPTLTYSGFHTEVHHINGEGDDAGVVYCEMQARENNGPSRITRKMVEKLWPGDCGYKSETGGIMANLRALHVDTVRKYHKDFYRPDNLCVVIIGHVDVAAVFAALEGVEERVQSKGPLPPHVRPWMSPVPPLTCSHDELVEFPADDDSIGMVRISWRGPLYRDFMDQTALEVLWEYLTDSAVSPLRKNLVEIDDPFCSSVDWGFTNNSIIVSELSFDSVPTEKLDAVKGRFFEIIHEQLQNGVDLIRMASVLERRRLKHLSQLEEHPHYSLIGPIISDFLYANEDTTLDARLACQSRYLQLEGKEAAFWSGLIRKFILDKPHVCVRGRPSITLGKEMAEVEFVRVKTQAESLGEAKLKELSKLLESSTAANEVEIPPHILDNIKVPDVVKIPRIPISTLRCAPTASVTDPNLAPILDGQSPSPFPFFFQFDNVASEFVYMTLLVDTCKVSELHRLFLEIYLDVVFKTPVQRDGTLTPYEDVVAALNSDTISSENGLGFSGYNFVCGPFAQLALLKLKLEASKFEKGVRWLSDLMWRTEFPPERLKVAAKKLIADVTEQKRDGMKMCTAAMKEVNFDKASNHSATNLVRQQRFLTALLTRLESEPGQVVEEFAQFRTELARPGNIRLHIAGNIQKLPPMKPILLSSFLPADYSNTDWLSHVSLLQFSSDYLKPTAKNPSNKGVIIGLGAIESSFLVQCCPGPHSFQHPDIAPMMVLIEYLTTLEGPFWKQLRGLGLAYSYSIRMDLEDGQLYFVLFKSGSLVKAYTEAGNIIAQYASNKGGFDAQRLEAAKSSVLYAIISREDTRAAAATQSIMCYFRRVPQDYNLHLLRQVQGVTVEELERVCKTHLMHLFDNQHTNLAITTNPSKVPEIKDGFAALGRDIQQVDTFDAFVE